jgi:hypothetical protein
MFTGAKLREWMGCWGLLGLLLIVSQWIIPENSLLSTSKYVHNRHHFHGCHYCICESWMFVIGYCGFIMIYSCSYYPTYPNIYHTVDGGAILQHWDFY